MKSWILKRLREPSTWAGLVALVAGAGGFQLDEEQRQAVVQLGMAIAGVLFVFSKEPESPNTDATPAPETTPTVAPKVETSKPAVPSPLPQPPTRGLVGRVNRNRR